VVFLLLGRLAHAPDEHRDVLEVIHHVLSLGFMGDYRTKADGHRQIDAIRHRLHAMLESQKTSPGRELSRHWRGVVQGKFQLLRSLPVWVTVLTLSLLLFGQFVWSKYQLIQERQEVLQSIQALKSLQPPPSPPRKSLRLAQLLEREISEGLVRVEEDDKQSAVIFKGEGMFAGGAYTLSPVTQQITSKVAQAIADVSGNVQILGHTDNQPVGSPPERNVQLSLKRAQEVAKVLQEKGVDPVRIQSTGKGDKEPVATNDTPAGRALNRRVEIVVSATEPLLKDKK
jgi:type VI secretion system protein ImpK